MSNENKNLTEQNTQSETPMTVKELIKAEKAELKAKKKADKLKKKGALAVDHRGNPIPDLDKKHVKGIESKKSMYGRMFILPWEIGMVLFFIIPLAQSCYYTFCNVMVDTGGFPTEFVGLDNIKSILFSADPTYKTNLTSSLGTFFTQLPIVVIVSLILAVVLNSNFKGRAVFRGIFFVPVIVATGVVMTLLTKSWGSYGAIIQLSSTMSESAYSAVGTGGGMDFTVLLNSLNLPEDVTSLLSGIVTDIFNTIWTCGIPIVLFLAGLQSIPAALYEASKVEGATKWEEFWYITIPMLGNTILLVIVFTIIELFTQSDNAVIKGAYDLMLKADYSLSSAMLWVFFAIIGVIIALVIGIYSKVCLKRWN